MDTQSAIETLVKAVSEPTTGLPDNIFYYISQMTPLVNADLLIKDEIGRTLLSWRNDRFAGTGWHIPGGIVRFKETLEARIERVAEVEIGAPVRFNRTPIVLHQLIHEERGIRGHFISLLYRCFLPGAFKPRNKGLSQEDAGYLEWHAGCPSNLLGIHEIYRKYIEATNPAEAFHIVVNRCNLP